MLSAYGALVFHKEKQDRLLRELMMKYKTLPARSSATAPVSY